MWLDFAPGFDGLKKPANQGSNQSFLAYMITGLLVGSFPAFELLASGASLVESVKLGAAVGGFLFLAMVIIRFTTAVAAAYAHAAWTQVRAMLRCPQDLHAQDLDLIIVFIHGGGFGAHTPTEYPFAAEVSRGDWARD